MGLRFAALIGPDGAAVGAKRKREGLDAVRAKAEEMRAEKQRRWDDTLPAARRKELDSKVKPKDIALTHGYLQNLQNAREARVLRGMSHCQGSAAFQRAFGGDDTSHVLSTFLVTNTPEETLQLALRHHFLTMDAVKMCARFLCRTDRVVVIRPTRRTKGKVLMPSEFACVPGKNCRNDCPLANYADGLDFGRVHLCEILAEVDASVWATPVAKTKIKVDAFFSSQANVDEYNARPDPVFAAARALRQ